MTSNPAEAPRGRDLVLARIDGACARVDRESDEHDERREREQRARARPAEQVDRSAGPALDARVPAEHEHRQRILRDRQGSNQAINARGGDKTARDHELALEAHKEMRKRQ
ncbi:MAG: hypothetical protein NTV21_02405 [Planctomycetota bacterium]|nr:hypothetical protein [Planctomycetota bacterium]